MAHKSLLKWPTLKEKQYPNSDQKDGDGGAEWIGEGKWSYLKRSGENTNLALEQ
jgi:hypothetical protein